MTRTIECAMSRAISTTHQEFQNRLLSLATIASLAPLLGFFCTVRSILFDAFGSGTGERSQLLANVALGIAAACLPTAFGLLMGLMSHNAYRYFQRRAALVDREMSLAAEVWMEWFRVVDGGGPPRPDSRLDPAVRRVTRSCS